MDDLLAKAGNQAVTFAIRSGISIVSGYAIRSLTRFLDKLPEDEKESLEKIKRRLNTKIKVVTPAIDLIQLIAARGNTSLDSTAALTRALRRDINEFDDRVEQASQRMQQGKSTDEKRKAARSVEQYMLGLLSRIEDSIPLISLALTTSGANLQASLPDTVSPSRLLQASAFLLAADSAFDSRPFERHQVGPTFTLRLYTVFYGTARNPHTTSAGDITWKEEYPKCYIEIFRVPIEHEDGTREGHKRQHKLAHQRTYSYELVLTEDLDDGRYHEEFDSEDPPKPDANGAIKGRSRTIPLSIITRLFFSASGRLLEIDDAISPVLVVKLNKAFLQQSPYAMIDDDWDNDEDEVGPAGPPGDFAENRTWAARVDSPANIEWLAFELWTDEADSDMDDDIDEDENDDIDEAAENLEPALNRTKPRPSVLSESTLAAALSRLTLSSADIEALVASRRRQSTVPTSTSSSSSEGHQAGPQRSAQSINSLSLLEYIIRLAALQTNDQASALNISDERIALYLRDENRTTTREATRDVSDPIGPAPSPVLASRFMDSGSRQRRSRTSTPISTPGGAEGGRVATGNSGTGGDSGLRRSTRIHDRSSPVEHPASAASATAAGGGGGGGAAFSRKNPVLQNLVSGPGVSASAPSTTAHHGPIRNDATTPKTPRAGISRHKQQQTANASGVATANDSVSLTPWEVDRLQALENNNDLQSPLEGKQARSRRGGRI
ncbi:RanGTP-binding protein-domain-containing protein [Lipomyces kononenkoae]|uniref:RanGTP-binding protein-domain-containing protein n=1 Tax=Lipomyces kononenkoae TaxID=34357 RepID=A0ACC3TB96_LIPKO